MTICACGTPVPTEAAARRHAAVCDRQGAPGCRVTVHRTVVGTSDLGPVARVVPGRCGAVCVDAGLCADHAAERTPVIAADRDRPCEGCGDTRRLSEAGPGWAVWECPTCGIAREETGA